MPYRPRVGDTRWIVEWCVRVGLVDDTDPDQGCDPDRDVKRFRYALDRAEAVKVARLMLPLSADGQVCFWPVEFVPYDEADAFDRPHAGFWEATGDPVCLTDDEG